MSPWLSVIVLLGNVHNLLGYYGDYTDYYPNTAQASDCSYEFLSSTRKNGTFTSPHYPDTYPENTRCVYVFQGQGKERVQISFEDLHLDYDATNPNQDCADEDSVVVSIKVGTQSRDIGRYCGTKKPDMLMSNNNKLEVHFQTRHRGPSTARGFKATYRFVNDFGIKAGTQDQEKVCGFQYRSSTAKNGTFTSPNYPGLYPRKTECTYIFYGHEDERVQIQFPYFDVEGVPPNCDDKTQSDYLEFSNYNIHDRKMSRFCGTIREKDPLRKMVQSDGPYFKVLFKSNDMYDARGFEAFYQFTREEKQELPYTNTDAPGASSPRYNAHQCFITLLSTLLAALAFTTQSS